MPDLPVSCRLTDTALRERREGLLARVFARAGARRPLGEGYAFEFPPDDSLLQELAQVIVLERRCCPFLTFRLTVGSGGGPVTLELTGPAGTREFLESELKLTGPDGPQGLSGGSPSS